ncbi:MAG: nucleoside phosphorylase [Proteobacteria bacterium]|nr:nucleoside phosphorylase [Pseudomonadota bacterium]
MSTAVGIVTGMRAEAAIARRCTRLVASTGGYSGDAEAKAGDLIERGAVALISFGIAGGLEPSLPTGALVVATGVIVRNATIATDAAWCARLLAGLPGAIAGTVLGGDRIICRAALKAELFERTGALAVDLESGGVARVAASARLPFVVVRTIADAAASDLPPAALVGLDRRGGVDVAAVLGSLWREPGQLAKLFAAARDTRAALAALRLGVRRLKADLRRV